MFNFIKGEIVLKKRVLSGLLAIALIFGSAAALPEGVFETSSTIRASADSYVSGDLLYEYELSENGKFVMITKYLDKTSTTCPIPETIDGKPVEIIAHAAFRDHTELKKVVFPKSLRGIANVAFKGCTSLRELDLPETLTQISDNAFEGCTDLESVTIPKGVKTIGKNAFANCECLDSVTIQDGVGGIDVGAFSGCTWLSNITIPGSVKTIAVNAFNKCINLERVTISDGVEFIGAYAFTGCPGLSRLVIPQSVKTIGKDTTAYPYPEDNPICDKDKCSIACYPGSNALTYAAFNGYKIEYISGDYIYKELKDETVEITGYLGKDKILTIPSELAEKKVSGIGNGAFANMSDLTSVTIQKGIKSIGDSAFAMCESLKSITIPSGVTSIDRDAFMGCSSLKSVTVPKSVTSFGEHALGFIYDKNYKPAVKSDFIIECYKDSDAEKYAKDNNIKYEYVSVKHVAAKKATCTTDGNIEYWKYDGKFYSDANLTTEITQAKTVVKATGHKWGTPSWTWNGTASASAKFVCSNDKSHVETVTADITSKTTKATCEKDGKTVCTATVTFGGKTYTDTKTVKIDKLGHKYGEPTWTWNGVKSATAKFTCENNSKHVETVDATITSKATKATCEKDGKTVYTATVTFGGKTYTDTKTVTIKKTGHKFSAWKTTGFDFAKKTSTQTRKCSYCGKTVRRTNANAINRLAGDNRFSTAAAISKASYPNGADTVILAFGLNYADALAGVPLAEKLNAPILLTHTKTLPDETLAEIKRLGAKKVIILGGEGAITKNVVKTLEANGLKTKRIAGQSRFGTATAIAAELNKAPEELFFVYGLNSADALSVGGVAAAKGAPIIYLTTDGKLNADTEAYLKSVKGKVKNAYIIGGDGVISNAMMKNVATALGLTVNKTVIRVAGKNRYETCVAVNKKFKSTLSSDGICVAKGLDFPDALAGGVFAAKTRQALFLADGKKLQDVQSSYLKGKNASKITVFGGVGAVPDDLVKLIAEASV